MIKHWVLEGKEIRECGLMEWARSMESTDRKIARDEIGDITVSTVFLGIDHGFEGGKPLLFETMVFGGQADEIQERYCTYEEAERGHKEILEFVKSIT